MGNDKQPSRLASLEDELQQNCKEFLSLQSRQYAKRATPGREQSDRVLKSIMLAVSAILHAYDSTQSNRPHDFSVITAFSKLVQYEQTSIDDLDEASMILCRLAAITNALIQEQRLAEDAPRRTSRPPAHKRSGVRRLSGLQRAQSIPPPNGTSIAPPSRRAAVGPGKRRR
ncbi:MAG: hypothetical protein WA001_01330 [Patescibacteria group bacterium]